MKENKDLKNKAKELFNNVKDESSSFDKKEAENGKAMGILSYILPFVPYFAEKENKFVRYHAIQGMNLLIIAIIYAILRYILSYIYVMISCGTGFYGELCRAYAGGWYLPWYLNIPMLIIGAGITILCIMGIINVYGGKAKELPIVNKVKIFKK